MDPGADGVIRGLPAVPLVLCCAGSLPGSAARLLCCPRAAGGVGSLAVGSSNAPLEPSAGHVTGLVAGYWAGHGAGHGAGQMGRVRSKNNIVVSRNKSFLLGWGGHEGDRRPNRLDKPVSNKFLTSMAGLATNITRGNRTYLPHVAKVGTKPKYKTADGSPKPLMLPCPQENCPTCASIALGLVGDPLPRPTAEAAGHYFAAQYPMAHHDTLFVAKHRRLGAYCLPPHDDTLLDHPLKESEDDEKYPFAQHCSGCPECLYGTAECDLSEEQLRHPALVLSRKKKQREKAAENAEDEDASEASESEASLPDDAAMVWGPRPNMGDEYFVHHLYEFQHRRLTTSVGEDGKQNACFAENCVFCNMAGGEQDQWSSIQSPAPSGAAFRHYLACFPVARHDVHFISKHRELQGAYFQAPHDQIDIEKPYQHKPSPDLCTGL